MLFRMQFDIEHQKCLVDGGKIRLPCASLLHVGNHDDKQHLLKSRDLMKFLLNCARKMNEKEWEFAIKYERMARQNKVPLKFDKSTNWRDDDRIDAHFLMFTAKRKLIVWDDANQIEWERRNKASKHVGFNDCNQTADIFKFIYTYFAFFFSACAFIDWDTFTFGSRSFARARMKWKIFHCDSLTVFFTLFRIRFDHIV